MPRADDKRYWGKLRSLASAKSKDVNDIIPLLPFKNEEFAKYYQKCDPIRFYGYSHLLKIENVPQNKGKNISNIVRGALLNQFQNHNHEICQLNIQYYNKTNVFIPVTETLARNIVSNQKLKINSKTTTLVCCIFAVFFALLSVYFF